MRKSWKYLIMGTTGLIFVVLFSFAKFSGETVKVISSLRKTLKQVILKEKATPGYDVVTSASLRVDEKSSLSSGDKS